MYFSKEPKEYVFLDSGNKERLEAFGDVVLIRPYAQALWKPVLKESEWEKADSCFSRQDSLRWVDFSDIPESWVIRLQDIKLKLKRTDFGHVGVFPEHSFFWDRVRKCISSADFQPNILNLFAYSGGITCVAAKAGAKVCHVDASKGMVNWASENIHLNNLADRPVRWIVDDVKKFLIRALKRGEQYDGIVLDPPTFGRANGGVFKIEEDLKEILYLCKSLLSERALFLLLTGHTGSVSPIVFFRLLEDLMFDRKVGKIEYGETLLPAKKLQPAGSFAFWSSCE